MTDHLSQHYSFPLEGEAQGFRLPTEEQERLARIPLQGKNATREAGRRPHAIILHGAPGAGKTHQGYIRLQKLPDTEKSGIVIVSYDEHGAMFDIPAYQAALKKVGNNEQSDLAPLRQVFMEYHQDSLRIRSLTLNLAIAGGHDIYIDITASGGGTGSMLELLEKQGYETEVWSYHASWDVSQKRIANRYGRVLEAEDVSYRKRIGALKNFGMLTSKAGTFLAFLNDSNSNEPSIIFELKAGQVVRADSHGVEALRAIWQDDIKQFEIAADPAIVRQAQALQAATRDARSALDKICPAAPGNRPATTCAPKPAPT